MWKRDALRRRDRNLSTWMSLFDGGWWQSDTPEARRVELLGVLRELSATHGDGQVLVWSVHLVLAWVERYLGLAEAAVARMKLVMGRLRESGSWVIPRQRAGFGLEYVASAIASAEASGGEVSLDAQALLDELPPQACGTIDLNRAAIAHLAGDRLEALRLLDRAEAEPGKERTRLVGICARVARARLTGGEASRRIVQAELAGMRTYGCADPQRLLDSWWPGFRGRARD